MTAAWASAWQHLYVHVPFCDGKCHYCGFYSGVMDEATRAAYAPLPGRELALHLAGSAPAPRTLYFGGGTPGMLGIDGLCALVGGLRASVSLDGVDEWTVELNPRSVTHDLVEGLRWLGVNRISLGVQCFDDAVLRAIGRRQTVADVEQALQMVRAAGFENFGLDLIAGLPGLTPEAWRVSLARACDLGAVHLSVYALSIEPGTELARRVAAGTVTVPDAEAQLESLAVAESVLAAAGLARYEISNYARPGFECLHNLSCWRGEDYLGLGPSASSRAGCRRWTNRADVGAYMQSLSDGLLPPTDTDELSPEADAVERFIFGLRLDEGVRPDAFAAAYPAAAARLAEWHASLTRLEKQGAVTHGMDRAWRLTSRGREVADAVLAELA